MHLLAYIGSPLGPLLALLAPVVAMILQFAISRAREFKADAVGAEISGKPLALASALNKMQQIAQRAPMDVPPSMAPIAQVNPLSGFRGLSKLFSTHPSTARNGLLACRRQLPPREGKLAGRLLHGQLVAGRAGCISTTADQTSDTT